jgi:ubiquitin C-terminal hydrolase
MKLITFQNLGNTCYINSVLQCFIYNPYFRKYCDIPDLKKIIVESDIIKNNENLNVTYNLTTFVNSIFHKKTQFKRFQQSDAHEFLLVFLELLTQEVHGRMDFYLDTRNKNWSEFLKTNNFSPFIGEFFGQSKLNINCLGCRKTSSTFEEYNTINLTVPKETKSVCDLFVRYLGNILQADPSNLYFCETCKGPQISQHKQSIVILPRTLIIVLKRYSSSGTKIKSEVILDKYLHIHENGIQKYTLTAVVNHQGNLFDGHYTSCVFINNEWYLFDDENISKIETFNYSNQDAYILFYSS